MQGILLGPDNAHTFALGFMSSLYFVFGGNEAPETQLAYHQSQVASDHKRRERLFMDR